MQARPANLSFTHMASSECYLDPEEGTSPSRFYQVDNKAFLVLLGDVCMVKEPALQFKTPYGSLRSESRLTAWPGKDAL